MAKTHSLICHYTHQASGIATPATRLRARLCVRAASLIGIQLVGLGKLSHHGDLEPCGKAEGEEFRMKKRWRDEEMGGKRKKRERGRRGVCRAVQL